MYLYRVAKYKRPQIFLEEPHRLTVPIVISHYRHKKPVTVNRTTGNTWGFRNKDNNEKPSTGTTVCRWYKKRRALKRLEREHDKEQKRIQQTEKTRREEELLQQLLKREQYLQEINKKRTQKVFTPPSNAVQKAKVQTKVKKVRHGRATSVKPKAQSKYVTVNKYNRSQSLSERFVNWFYRTCCQLYCCVSIVLVLGITVIILI
ncbi:unnamed protein product [Chilo suppressalis]|uniref:Uncharacterized protein n=1 Tax=Chilo suppressalis TaxID=168631 RepID=A0ABN8EAG0_CHISP|nr:unnamed protein product [Chilo suppressalis]